MTLALVAALVLSADASKAPLTFGLTQSYGEAHAKQAKTSLEPWLSKALGSAVTVTVFPTSDALGEALLAGKVDLAWMTPLAFVQAARKNPDVIAVSKAVREGGSIYYRAALVVKAGSPVKVLADLKGKKVAWVSKSSTSGYLFARELLKQQGQDPDRFFGAETFAGDHTAACKALKEGSVDVAATFASEPADGKTVLADGCGDAGKLDEFRVVASTGNLPSEVIAAKADLDRRRLNAIVTAFGQMSQSADGKKVLKDAFRAQGWGIVVDGDFDAVSDLVRGSGPKLKITTPDPEPKAQPPGKKAAQPEKGDGG